ncbi:MAG: hypothetical protein RL095_1932 [Verrucomicrobiota bacterium]|jgi:dihydropteroate synthase
MTRTRIMGVLNATPDSFSDGGLNLDPSTALAAGLKMIAEGADILDIGGESTRPGSPPVSLEEELRRVLPVIAALRSAQVPVEISIDTSKPEVAAAALEAGATWINDVTGFRDPRMRRLAAERGCFCVAMHLRGTPADMMSKAVYADVVAEVKAELASAVEVMLAAGISRQRILLDPGFGFAKNTAQNLELLARFGELRSLGLPLLAGCSRKSFIGATCGENEARRRLPGTLAAHSAAQLAGASVLRVHDVAEAVQAARLIDALLPFHPLAGDPHGSAR